MMFRTFITAGAAFAAALLVLATPASAQHIGGDLNLDADQDRDVSFLAADVTLRGRVGGSVQGMAADVLIDADVSGDVSLAAADVTIGGRVGGDVSLAAANVNITADVGGDVDAAGADVRIAGRVRGDVSAAGALIVVDQSGMIGGDASLAGREIRIVGGIGGRVDARARNILIDTVLNGDLELYGETVEFGPEARIAGNVRVRSPNAPVIDEAAVITGEINHVETAYSADRRRHSVTGVPTALRHVGPPGWAIGGTFSTTAFVLGLLACLVAPKATSGITQHFRAKPWAASLLGLVIFAFLPVLVLTLFVMLLITVIGIPLALIVVLGFPIFMFLAYAFGALAIGDVIMNRSGGEMSPGMRILSLFLVLLVIAALGVVPVIGFLLALVALFIGLGAWTLAIFSRNPREAAAAAPPPAAPHAPSAASEAV
ncbi:hypothetical protein FKB34_05380 [Glycocaulis profundi]|nr:hypothetical protein FKB34_05380 [Glycocaulis profundi]